MSWNVLGPGLVGCFLGAAGGAGGVVARGGGPLPRATVRLPDGALRTWAPTPVAAGDDRPLLLACRVHQDPGPWGAGRPLLAAQNGLGQAAPVVVCFMALDRGPDGMIAAMGVRPRLVLARPAACWRPALAAWCAAGLTVEEVDDVAPAQWEKAILNATVGPLCLAHGLGMSAVWADPAHRALALAATAEGGRIAAAAGVAIPAGLEARAAEFFTRVGSHRPSVLKDPGELPWILGRLLAAARAHGVAAPALERIASLSAAADRTAALQATP